MSDNNKELINIRSRLKDLIVNNCNVVGCEKCSYKWEDTSGRFKYSCMSDELQDKEFTLMEAEK